MNSHFLKEITELKPAEDQWPYLQQLMCRHQIAIFLDYDGTLTPVSPHPEDAYLSAKMRETLQKLSTAFKVFVVSGRDKKNVEQFVDITGIPCIGNHGLDMEQSESAELQVKLEQCKPIIAEARAEIFAKLTAIDGIQIEPKKFTTAIHYRHVAETQQEEVIKLTQSIVKKYPLLKVIAGKKVLDVAPDIHWNKGKAVLSVLANGFAPDVYPIYIGDDITDESAFFELPEFGMGILVGDHGAPTYADFWLKSYQEVGEFLQHLFFWFSRYS